jgi:hypothetical protein
MKIDVIIMEKRNCVICEKEFQPKVHNQKCCSPECSKENKRRVNAQWREDNRESKREYDAQYYQDNREHKRELNEQWREDNPEYFAQWYKDNREYRREKDAQWCADNPEYHAQWRADNPEYDVQRIQNKVSELCKQYDGDLEQILENIPSRWMVREAKMQVWFGESYADGMIAKIKSTPVCEVTGASDDLVIHHLWSFNTHPELGNDPANMVRITKTVHNKFHKLFGYGKNTPEQWNEFIEKFDKE